VEESSAAWTAAKDTHLSVLAEGTRQAETLSVVGRTPESAWEAEPMLVFAYGQRRVAEEEVSGYPEWS
jgi:hypothetical protein